jgi:septal ring factor EnvC (AmiA/AmiB activator)
VAAATASIGDDDNTIEEPEVIMLDLDLRMLGKVSLSKAMGTTHFVLNEVHDMLHREREDLEEERLHLGEWGSLQKEWTTSEKEKMVVKQKFLDVMEVLLNKKQTAIDELDAKSQKLLDDIKELYTAAEAHANATSSSSRTSTHKRSPLPNGSRRWQTGC